MTEGVTTAGRFIGFFPRRFCLVEFQLRHVERFHVRSRRLAAGFFEAEEIGVDHAVRAAGSSPVSARRRDKAHGGHEIGVGRGVVELGLVGLPQRGAGRGRQPGFGQAGDEALVVAEAFDMGRRSWRAASNRNPPPSRPSRFSSAHSRRACRHRSSCRPRGCGRRGSGFFPSPSRIHRRNGFKGEAVRFLYAALQPLVARRERKVVGDGCGVRARNGAAHARALSSPRRRSKYRRSAG